MATDTTDPDPLFPITLTSYSPKVETSDGHAVRTFYGFSYGKEIAVLICEDCTENIVSFVASLDNRRNVTTMLPVSWIASVRQNMN